MEPILLFSVFIFLVGTAIGSFLNVVICRVPNNQSIVFPASHCPNCGHKITALENIPILSYLFLKGRCSGCKQRISIQYPLVELLTGLIFMIVAIRFQITWQTLIFLIFSAILIALSVIDLKTRLLPDVITLPATLGACALSICSLFPSMKDVWTVTPQAAFLGILTGAGPLFVVAYLYFKITGRDGLGGGDIKLMIFIGILLGPRDALLTLFLGAFVGTIIGIPLVFFKKEGRQFEIPFGPFLSGAAWIAALWGKELIQWYLQISGISSNL